MAQPIFSINDVIYLIESAARGFLESYRIVELRQIPTGEWFYRIGIPQRPPTGIGTVGDRNNLKQSFDLDYTESDLTTYCNALALVRNYLQAQLTKTDALIAACNETSESGS